MQTDTQKVKKDGIDYWTCCLCNETFSGFGNNPEPVNNDINNECCDNCNDEIVIPARLSNLLLGGWK